MKFFIETDNTNDLHPEVDIIKLLIRQYSHMCNVSYDEFNYAKFKRFIEQDRFDKSIIDKFVPFGSIKFIRAWLNHYYNRDMQPIEIPTVLRTEEFLKRDYYIVAKHNVPKTGRYFIKNVSRLKSGSFLGYAESWQLSKDEYDDSDIFSVSTPVNIVSEWRVYYIDGEIKNISNYDGNPIMFPDVSLINKMIYEFDRTGLAPKDYSIDVAVTTKGTVILEIHPFAALGLYSTVFDQDLIYAYQNAIQWYATTKYTLKGE